MGEWIAKAGRKVCVFLGLQGSKLITVKLRESHGHSGVVNLPVRAEGVTFELLCDWLEESYRIVAPKRLIAELDGRH